MSSFLAILFMVAIVLVAALGLGAVVAITGIASAGAPQRDPPQREWATIWNGHEIVLQSEPGAERLFIDGTLLAELRDTRAGKSTPLEGRVDGSVVRASIQRQDGGPTPKLTIDGRSVLPQRRPFGTARVIPGSGAEVREGVEEPDDPRWEAAVELVKQIAPQGGEAARLALEARAELRTLLLEIGEAERATDAHRKLGASDAPLRAVIEQREAQVARVVEALRELHFGTIQEKPTAENTSRLLAALEVELAGRNGS